MPGNLVWLVTPWGKWHFLSRYFLGPTIGPPGTWASLFTAQEHLTRRISWA